MILARKCDQGFDAVTLGRCGVYPCAGARDNVLAECITELFSDPSRLADWRLRLLEENGRVRIEAAA